MLLRISKLYVQAESVSNRVLDPLHDRHVVFVRWCEMGCLDEHKLQEMGDLLWRKASFQQLAKFAVNV